MWKEGEKRKVGDRRRVELDVDLSTYGSYFLSKLANISTGGVFITASKIEPVGTELKLRFRLPGDEDPIEAEGQVAWIYDQPGKGKANATGMGVKFTKILLKDQERIAQFVASSSGA